MLTWFAFLKQPGLSPRPMMTGYPIDGRHARSLARRAGQGLAVAGLLAFAPLAASTAAAPDAPAARMEPAAATAAVIELVPLQAAATELPASTPAQAEPAPSAPQETVIGRGSASYYAAKFEGRRTASGERYDDDEMTAAHRTLPFGSLVRVTNLATGRSVVVRVNDRGPFTRGRTIDVSRAAADELGLVARGHADVELALIAD